MQTLEKAFREIKGLLRTKDMRLKRSKHEVELARQEFLSEIKDLSEEWFNKRIKAHLKCK